MKNQTVPGAYGALAEQQSAGERFRGEVIRRVEFVLKRASPALMLRETVYRQCQGGWCNPTRKDIDDVLEVLVQARRIVYSDNDNPLNKDGYRFQWNDKSVVGTRALVSAQSGKLVEERIAPEYKRKEDMGMTPRAAKLNANRGRNIPMEILLLLEKENLTGSAIGARLKLSSFLVNDRLHKLEEEGRIERERGPNSPWRLRIALPSLPESPALPELKEEQIATVLQYNQDTTRVPHCQVVSSVEELTTGSDEVLPTASETDAMKGYASVLPHVIMPNSIKRDLESAAEIEGFDPLWVTPQKGGAVKALMSSDGELMLLRKSGKWTLFSKEEKDAMLAVLLVGR